MNTNGNSRYNKLTYELVVRGIYGRNRKLRFEVFRLVDDVPPSAPKTLAEVRPLADKKLAEIKLKSGQVRIEERPIEVSAFFSGAEKIEMERFTAASERVLEEWTVFRWGSCVMGTGVSYFDRWTEKYGDYKRLAFLPFRELVLKVEADCPADMRAEIERDAACIIARRGEQFQVSTAGQFVVLGE